MTYRMNLFVVFIFTATIATGSISPNKALLARDEISFVAVNTFNVPPDAPPVLLQTGDAINLFEGGVLGESYLTSDGSQLNILGGTLGNSARIFGELNISGGSIGESLHAGGPTTISGGILGSIAEISGELNITGGSIGESLHTDGPTTVSGGIFGFGFTPDGPVNISGGTFAGGVFTVGGGEPHTSFITGGTFGDYFSTNEGDLQISGGTFGSGFLAGAGTKTTISGGHFADIESDDYSLLTISGGTFNSISIVSAELNLVGSAFTVFSIPIPQEDLPLSLSAGNMEIEVTQQDGSIQRFFVIDTSASIPSIPSGFVPVFASEAVITFTRGVPEPSSFILLCSLLLGIGMIKSLSKKHSINL